MADSFLAGQGGLWIQPNGLGLAPAYLGCHGVGDVDLHQRQAVRGRRGHRIHSHVCAHAVE